jgi:tRNA(adenine34) deaminase
MFDNQHMLKALNEAEQALLVNEVPVGAVVVKDGQAIASAHNLTITSCDPTAHAEIVAIRKAAEALCNSRLDNCDLYVTLEPCPMCAQAISLARIRRLYIGALDVKGGGIIHGPKIYHHKTAFHKPEIYDGIMSEECGKILSDFFKKIRKS